MTAFFHFACNVLDLESTRRFYGGLLGCEEGRSTDTWIDYDFFGHQLSFHLGEPFATHATGRVDGRCVPMPHFGVILDMQRWQELAAKLTDAGVDFVIPPGRRFVGEPGEQATMFFRDPSGNPIEIKGFSDLAEVYAR